MGLERCAVLGAGNAGHAYAADLTLAGIEVNLYELPQFRKNLQPIIERGGIEIRGKARQGFTKVSKVTTDIEEAIRDVKYLFVAVQAVGHEVIAKTCAPYLVDGQAMILMPGSLGSLQIARTLKELRVNKKIYIGESVTLPYGCRLIGPAEVNVLFTPVKNYFSAFPAEDTEKILDDLKAVYPSLCPATNVLEAGLLNPNIMKHPMLLFSLSQIESSKKRFSLNREGMTPSVWKIFDQVIAERTAILKKFGLNALSYWEVLSEVLPFSYDEFCSILPDESFSTNSRYFTEDVPIGMVLLSSLGDMIGVDTPIIDSIIHMVGVITETDCYKQGRTVEKLGISGMDVETLNRFLAEGK